MLLDYLLGGLVTLGLLVYLVHVLLRPERFGSVIEVMLRLS
jgi:K+-transporting ATPase KdpF subunit